MSSSPDQIDFRQITPYVYEIPKQGQMQVPARFFSSPSLLPRLIADNALMQLKHVATLPGILKYALAMPDIHWGYGFPIGGVAAFDKSTGIVSPGGVGYDINCGVRLAATALSIDEISHKTKRLIDELFRSIPAGVGSSGAIKKLSRQEMKRVSFKGAAWAIENGFGDESDLMFTEENGTMKIVDPEPLSDKVYKRGEDEVGTLGSGNHFLELDVIDEIYDWEVAKQLGLFKNQVVIQIHTGSRGFGYQICDEFLKKFNMISKQYKIDLVDRQLACVPIMSQEGQDYLHAMGAAANFAWANRQVIMVLAKKAIKKVLNISDSELQFRLIYDVAHNIAKFEQHNVEGKFVECLVHRKGATRSFGKGEEDIPEPYRKIGQPVLIPGDMGRYSFIAIGQEKAMTETFGSTCHGAGRVKSRKQAIRSAEGRNIIKELSRKGIYVQAKGKRTVAEEMPEAYKDVSEVIEVMDKENISKKVARLKPFGVIKG
ncbi:MAG: RNA ligase RtcB [Calditrichia bacterium]